MLNELFIIALFCLCDVFGNQEYVGNPDDMEDIDRPCAVYDIGCIRKFFAKHATCFIATGPAPDPYRRSQDNVFHPRVNVTIAVVDQVVKGLNGKIEQFFVNKNTGNLVIAIEFSPLIISSNNSYFIFHRRAKEPVVTVGYQQVSYQSVVVTAIIPNIDDLQLDKAEVTAFSNDAFPPVVVVPGIFESSDPTVQPTLAVFAAGLPINVLEMFLIDASVFASIYIQYNICDFGLKVE